MTSEWNHFALGEITELVIDYRGKTPKKLGGDWCKQGYRALSAKNIKTGRIVQAETIRYIDESLYRKWMKDEVQRGDILITSEAPFGQIFFWDSDEKIVLSQRLFCVRIKPEYDARFIYYYMTTPEFQSELDGRATGTTVIGLRQPELMKCIIRCPEIQEQKVIAAILSSIDAKIIANEKVNDNLQRQLRTIFKAEFTDNPELEKMTQIPLSELCHVVTKGTTPTTLGKPFVESGINFIKAESILADHSLDKSKFAFIDEETNALLKRSVIHAGDIVFTIAGTLGRFALIDDNALPANTNQAVAIIRADAEKVLPEYIYTCFIGEWHTDYYAKRVQQAVQANLSLTTIKSLPIPVLDKAKMDEYLRLILPLIKAIKGNEAQNEKLAALRDALLPKLMSGEIDVSAVQL